MNVIWDGAARMRRKDRRWKYSRVNQGGILIAVIDPGFSGSDRTATYCREKTYLGYLILTHGAPDVGFVGEDKKRGTCQSLVYVSARSFLSCCSIAQVFP